MVNGGVRAPGHSQWLCDACSQLCCFARRSFSSFQCLRFHFPFQYRCAASSRTGGARESAACVFLRVALRTCQGANRGHGSFHVYFLDAAFAAKRLRSPNERLDIPFAKHRQSAHAALPPQFGIHSVQQTFLPRIYMDARKHSNYLCFVCAKPPRRCFNVCFCGLVRAFTHRPRTARALSRSVSASGGMAQR